MFTFGGPYIANNMFVTFRKLIPQVGKLARHLGLNECKSIKTVHTLRNVNKEVITQSPGAWD